MIDIPNDPEAEWDLLALVITDTALMQEIAHWDDEVFYIPMYRQIFKAYKYLYRKGQEPSIPLLREILSQWQVLTGDMDNTLIMLSMKFTLADVPAYWTGVKERVLSAYQRRLLMNYAQDILKVAQQPSPQIMSDEIFDIAKRKLDEYIAKGSRYSVEIYTPEDLLSENGKDRIVIDNSLLSQIFQGFEEGEFLVVAARPGVGKTAMLLTDAFDVSQFYPTLFVSREMSVWELKRRIDAYTHGKTAEMIKDRQFFITTAASTPSQILMAAKEKKVKFIYIDYVQRLSGDGKFRTREEEIGYISNALKDMALDMNLVIVAAAQLNRDLERRENKEPRLADLRDSGRLEQDANQVLFLWREMDDTSPIEIYWKIGKNRRGSLSRGSLVFAPKHMQFYIPTST